MDKKEISAIGTIFILVFLGWYICYNTSLTFGDLISRQGPIEKYLKCAREGEDARENDNDADMPARCCRGLKMEYHPSVNSILIITGESGTCVK